ncbi:MAG TPA: hypothetical protein VD789_09935, partial [Thermomicrobiales bacterium]|nr:hypothetical protein [Thermomicrobiales bacterium]
LLVPIPRLLVVRVVTILVKESSPDHAILLWCLRLKCRTAGRLDRVPRVGNNEAPERRNIVSKRLGQRDQEGV